MPEIGAQTDDSFDAITNFQVQLEHANYHASDSRQTIPRVTASAPQQSSTVLSTIWKVTSSLSDFSVDIVVRDCRLVLNGKHT